MMTHLFLQVGPSYGRKLMHGYLKGKGIAITPRQSLPSASPQAHYQRQHDNLDGTNPHVYVARYFGHKLHVDQNEK